MLARIRKSMKEKDQGFTLIELLVVMVIIGVLAAIAIPVFTSQRAKAVDSAAKSDVSVLGKEIATYLVDGTALPVVGTTGTGASAQYTLGATAATARPVSRVSDNVSAPAFKTTSTVAAWCVQVTVADGTVGNQHYASATGLGSGACP